MQLNHEQRRLPLAKLAALLHTELGDTVRLPDERLLGFAEFGDPNGFPVLHFHGACSSRLEAALFGQAAAESGLRMIGVDRPGMGLSSPVDKPGYLSWPQDVRALADQLGLERFAVAGLSGGGVYACACGVDPDLRERLAAVILICGMLPATPGEKKDQLRNVAWTLEQMAGRPWLGRLLVWLIRRAMMRGMKRGVLQEMPNDSDLDRQIARMPGLASVYGIMVLSGLSQGSLPAVKDMAVYGADFEFELADIAVPVRSFHGTRDRNVPLSLARRVVASVPDGQLVEFADAGHMFPAWFAQDITAAVAKLCCAASQSDRG